MKTKEEILKQCGFGSLKERSEITIKYCQVEALLDIRDELGLILDVLEEGNNLKRSMR